MATDVTLPRLGQGMESGTIVKWLKSEGDTVQKGEPLYELDTDKVTQEVEADTSGVLLRIAVSEGEVEVGKTIAVIGQPGEEVAAAASPAGDHAESPDGASAGRQPQAEAPGEEGRPAEARPRTDGRVKASPLARRIARERGVDLAGVRGTGPDGRIVAEDVERTATAAPATAPAVRPRDEIPGQVEVRQLSNVRKTIARRLTQAWEAPVFQLAVSADMTQALALVGRLRELQPDVRPTLTDLLTRVTASALMRHRDVNALFVDGEIHVYPNANVGLAVAAPQGLVVPVVHAAERLSIAEIARVRADAVQRSREGKLRAEDLVDGTF